MKLLVLRRCRRALWQILWQLPENPFLPIANYSSKKWRVLEGPSNLTAYLTVVGRQCLCLKAYTSLSAVIHFKVLRTWVSRFEVRRRLFEKFLDDFYGAGLDHLRSILGHKVLGDLHGGCLRLLVELRGRSRTGCHYYANLGKEFFLTCGCA